jgi:hypothetical protein
MTDKELRFKVFNKTDTRNILKLLNSKAGRFLLGIKHNYPIVRFNKEWIEVWTGLYKDGKPVMQATVWVEGSNFVERQILIPYQKIKIAEKEYQPFLNKEKAFLHFSDLEYYKEYPQVYLLTTVKNPDTGEGHIVAATDTWANVRAAATGTATSNVLFICQFVNPNYSNRRIFWPFDTSTLGAITVSAADIQGYRDDAVNPFNNGDTTTMEIVPSQEADPTGLVAGDYPRVTFTSRGSKTLASTGNAAYQLVTISNFTEISGTAKTKYACICGLDLNNTTPTANNSIGFQNRIGANPAKLDITYTLIASLAYAIIL